MACYIVALQRRTHKLTVEDVKKLNVVTKKIKQAPVTLTFRNLGLDVDYEHLTVFSDAVGLRPTTFDSELEVKHRIVDGKAQLVLMIAKHVDDIKVTGEPYEVNLLMKELERVFGKLTVTKDEFTNCGVHQKRHSDGSITLDQDEYIKALIPIKHKELSDAPSTPASEELLSLYRSLLGAVAYTQLTQHHMACYIVALQRKTHKLTVEDVKKLNVVT
jgi:hypothetical protein